MHPINMLLMQNAKTGSYQIGDGGEPPVTREDGIMSGAGIDRNFSLAAEVVIKGNDSDKTLSDLEMALWQAFADIVNHYNWDVPAGSEIYRSMASMAVAESLRPSLFKTEQMKIIFLNRINEIRQPENPIEMTESKWHKKWKKRYASIFNELQTWASSYLRISRNKLG